MTEDLEPKLSPQQQYEMNVLTSAFCDVLSSPSGQRVLFWFLEQCAIYQDAFTGDNNATNYTLGRQSAGKRLIAAIDAIDAQLYPKLLSDIAMLKEMDAAATKRADKTEIVDDDDAA